MLPEQLKSMGLQIMLSNTYHLGTRPVSHNIIVQFKLLTNYLRA